MRDKQKAREYHQRKREDPEWLEKRRKQNREAKRSQMADPEERKRINEAWVKNHRKRIENGPEYRDKKNAEGRKRYRDNAESDPDFRRRKSVRVSVLRRGLTIKDYDEMSEAQAGLCAICGKPERRTYNGKVTRLSIDHCHKTGKVRALLCDWCNTGIGRFDDDIGLMEKAIEYLKKFQE